MPVKVDADKNRALLRKYGIRGLPTILFVDSQGRPISSVVGYKPPAKLVSEMDGVFDAMALQARSAIRKSATDGESHARLGLAYALAGRLAEAEKALKQAKASNYRGHIAAQAYNTLGDHFAAQKKWEDAEAAFNAASRLGRKEPAILAHAKLGLARTYVALGKESKARRTAKSVLRIKNVPARYAEAARELIK